MLIYTDLLAITPPTIQIQVASTMQITLSMMLQIYPLASVMGYQVLLHLGCCLQVILDAWQELEGLINVLDFIRVGKQAVLSGGAQHCGLLDLTEEVIVSFGLVIIKEQRVQPQSWEQF